MAEFTLTTGADTPALTAGDDVVIGNAQTLNPDDTLNGGDGTDTLRLFGSGTFDLNSIPGYTVLMWWS